MGKYKIEYDRKGCIGAGVCAALAEKHWVMASDGLADLVDSKENPETGLFEREIEESELDENMKAAEGCPAQVIHIINKETGEKLI